MEDTEGAKVGGGGGLTRVVQPGLGSCSGAACHTLLQMRTNNHFAFSEHLGLKGGTKSTSFASHKRTNIV